MGGTDVGAIAYHHFDLALKSRRTQRTLLLHIGANPGQAIVAQHFFEQWLAGNASSRHIGTKTQIFSVRHYHLA
ncbi:hypothetical protein [Rhodanobacter sp. MP7CTX1]|uniref:hypothetical protein n=1 Tax=Rhodanobacter sp. MP7CTX1 TaxID=2723084 RepID=UPI0017FAB20B|nr:hypothetical protein [Rhodanobacter sp. MP7CTX1]MBB6188714.1 hypothetical protein [Rhodanobacter sp. MP7CTX1]